MTGSSESWWNYTASKLYVPLCCCWTGTFGSVTLCLSLTIWCTIVYCVLYYRAPLHLDWHSTAAAGLYIYMCVCVCARVYTHTQDCTKTSCFWHILGVDLIWLLACCQQHSMVFSAREWGDDIPFVFYGMRLYISCLMCFVLSSSVHILLRVNFYDFFFNFVFCLLVFCKFLEPGNWFILEVDSSVCDADIPCSSWTLSLSWNCMVFLFLLEWGKSVLFVLQLMCLLYCNCQWPGDTSLDDRWMIVSYWRVST